MLVGLCIAVAFTACDQPTTGRTGDQLETSSVREMQGLITTMGCEEASFLIFTVAPANPGGTNATDSSASSEKKAKKESYYLAFKGDCVFAPEVLGEVLELGLPYRLKGQVISDPAKVSKTLGTGWRAGATENLVHVSEIELLAKAGESRLLSDKGEGLLMLSGGSDWTYMHGPKGEKTMGYGMDKGLITWNPKK